MLVCSKINKPTSTEDSSFTLYRSNFNKKHTLWRILVIQLSHKNENIFGKKVIKILSQNDKPLPIKIQMRLDTARKNALLAYTTIKAQPLQP